MTHVADDSRKVRVDDRATGDGADGSTNLNEARMTAQWVTEQRCRRGAATAVAHVDRFGPLRCQMPPHLFILQRRMNLIDT
jgi:hypothetical protein